MSVYVYIFLVYLDAITSSVPLQQILLIFTGTLTVQVLLPISSLKNDFCGSDNLSEDMIKSSPVFVRYVRKWRFDIAVTLDLLPLPLHQFILPCGSRISIKPSVSSPPHLTHLSTLSQPLLLLFLLSLQESWFFSLIPHHSPIPHSGFICIW